jgi:WXG100 family type VII secretion target
MLNNAAQVATRVGEGISLNLTRLLNEIESQSAVFQGQAGGSFQSVASELGRELKALLDALNEMADNVNQSGKVFGSTDADAAREISQVTNQYLPGASGVANALRG